jgi:hypothetical protein
MSIIVMLVAGAGTSELDPPENLVAEIDSLTQITVTADAVVGATSYNLYSSTISGSGYVLVGSEATPEIAADSLDPTDTYYFVMTAENGSSESDYSEEISAISGDLAVLPGLISWYRLGDLTTLFQDTAGTSPVTTDAQEILRVDDKSGNGYHITEATNGPTYKENIQGGKGIARFDGSDDILSNTSYPDFGDIFWSIIVSKRSTSASNIDVVFEASAATTFTGFWFRSTDFPSANSEFGAFDATTAKSAVGTTIEDNVFRILVGWCDGTKVYYLKDGVTVEVAYTSPNPNTLTTLTVGVSKGNTTNRLTGDIAELLIGTGTLSSDDRDAAIAILDAYYGL